MSNLSTKDKEVLEKTEIRQQRELPRVVVIVLTVFAILFVLVILFGMYGKSKSQLITKFMVRDYY